MAGYHERLRARIGAQRKEMRNGDYIREMVDKAATIIGNNAPNQDGILVRNITTQTPLRENANGFVKGLGDRAVVGKESSSPRGTIAAFLRDFPEFRHGGGGRDEKKEKDEEEKKVAPDYRGPWFGLSREAKDRLQEERLAGNYGGITSIAAGKSPYFFPQEGTFWAGSASKAGIIPTFFVAKSLDQWRAVVLPSIIARFKARFHAA